MSKHTPGPWTPHTFEPESNKEHFVTAGSAQQIPICKTGRRDLASAADARLIAASPELLEVCRTLLRQVVDDENARRKLGIVSISVPPLIDAAETAIAKATGQN